MKAFAEVFEALDTTTSTNQKILALKAYFERVDPASGAWAVFFLSGRRLTRFVPHGLLAKWLMEWTQMPEWLFEESYSAVGDLGETIALLLPSPVSKSTPHSVSESDAKPQLTLAEWMRDRILPL